jgi:hypothetical protein
MAVLLYCYTSIVKTGNQCSEYKAVLRWWVFEFPSPFVFRLLLLTKSLSTLSLQAAKILANLIIAGGTVLFRAASQAYRQAIISKCIFNNYYFQVICSLTADYISMRNYILHVSKNLPINSQFRSPQMVPSKE